jgi:hypothetical protein
LIAAFIFFFDLKSAHEFLDHPVMPSNIPKSNTFDDDTRKRLASLNTNNKSNNINNNNNVIPAFLKQITQERLLKSTFPAVEMPEWKRQLIEKKKQSQLLAAEN